MNFDNSTTPSAVAVLLGFNDAKGPTALGFRMNYEALENQGAFDACTTVGECLAVYCDNVKVGVKL